MNVRRSVYALHGGVGSVCESGGGSETLVLEPISDVLFPPSSPKDDMPLPDDIQLEPFGFW